MKEIEGINQLLPLSKQTIAMLALSRGFLRQRVGDLMDPIGVWAERLQVGRGTVQAALRLLEDAGGVHLNGRGRGGTRIEALDYLRLWEVTGSKVVVGTMPLPYTLRYQGLATGLYKGFEQAGLPLQMAYMRGAGQRLDGVGQGRYEFAVTSALAASSLIKERPDLEIALTFRGQSYTAEHVLLFASPQAREPWTGMRVGIDTASYDQRVLTEAITGRWSVQLVPVNYTHLLEMLMRGELDAAVWNGDEVRERKVQVGVVSLRELGLTLPSGNTEAALVLRRDGLLRTFLGAHFDPAIVEQTHQAVLSGHSLPSF
jgi:DNA-binding transcriptional ArsR family regulator